jgi:hypothetical protein
VVRPDKLVISELAPLDAADIDDLANAAVLDAANDLATDVNGITEVAPADPRVPNIELAELILVGTISHLPGPVDG